MTQIRKSLAASVAVIFIAVMALGGPGGQTVAQPKAETPILVTSCGQSTGPTMIKVCLQRVKLAFDVDTLAGPAVLQAKAKAGTPYKSLIITMGASLKGMGAAGISIDDELERAAALIAEAHKEGITVIGAHVEGLKRRAQGAAAGDTTDEQTIDTVAPQSNILVVYKEGNSDGRFTTISKSKGIPLIEFEKNMDLIPVLEKLFSK